MNTACPTVAFTIGMSNAIDGPGYHVYQQAYALEMTMDDEWPLNVIIMAPPHLIASMTQETDITSMGAIPGASYTPGDGDYKQISTSDGRWVLARKSDDISRILQEDLGVLLHIEDSNDINGLPEFDELNVANLIVAFQINSLSTLDTARETASAIKAKLADRHLGLSQILVSASFAHENLQEYASLSDVSGILLLDAHIGNVVELLRIMAG
ncbi:MAG: hypothetical protein HKN82_08235 [Akkermansiaceae bacterium]|nr:hypothetical protein [Akkermansiaceae bacterium]